MSILNRLSSSILNNKLNALYTALIYFNNFAYGITNNIIGSVMVDFGAIYRTNLNTMSYIQVAVGLGYLIGSFASYLYRYVHRQLCLTFFVFLMALTVAFLPNYGALYALFGMTALNNIGSGAWDSSTSIWLVDMWPVGNSALLQGNQFMFGLGAIVAPLLAAPFVYGDGNGSTVEGNRSLTIEDRVHSLTTPFAINGVIQAVVPIFFILSFFLCRYDKYDSSKGELEQEDDMEDIQNEDDFSSIPNRNFKIVLIGLSASIYVAAETGYFSFCSSMFQLLEIELTASEAAQVQSILSVTYTLGRLATAFISLKLKPDLILSYHFTILVGSVLLLVFGRNSLILVYIGNATLGFGFSAMWPGMFAFTEYYLRLTDRVCSLYACLAGAFSMIIPLILAQVFKSFPLLLMYLVGGFIATSLVLFIIVRLWISKQENLDFQEDLRIKDDFARRYSIAGPRMSMHFSNFRQDRIRRKYSIAPEKWFEAQENVRRKSTFSGKKENNKRNVKENVNRRKSTYPGF